MTQQELFWWGFPIAVSVLGLAWLAVDHIRFPDQDKSRK